MSLPVATRGYFCDNKPVSIATRGYYCDLGGEPPIVIEDRKTRQHGRFWENPDPYIQQALREDEELIMICQAFIQLRGNGMRGIPTKLPEDD